MLVSTVYSIKSSVFTPTDAVAFLNSHFGASSGTRTVYLDEVQCTGRETNLTDCPQSSSISCSSVKSYAGVRCQGLKKMMFHMIGKLTGGSCATTPCGLHVCAQFLQ